MRYAASWKKPMEMLDALPVHWRVVRNVRPKYSCRTCEKIVQTAAPVKAVERGEMTFSTLSHVVVSKFEHHLPLYRQSEMMAAQGLDIDRSTLAGCVGQAAALLDLTPSSAAFAKNCWKATSSMLTTSQFSCSTPAADATRPGGYGAMGLWGYAVDDRASGNTAPSARWYRFTTDRTGAHP